MKKGIKLIGKLRPLINVIPAKAGIYSIWIPAFAGMTYPLRIKLFILCLFVLFANNVFGDTDYFDNKDAPYTIRYYSSPFVFVQDDEAQQKSTFYYSITDTYAQSGYVREGLEDKRPIISISVCKKVEGSDLGENKVRSFFTDELKDIGSYSLDWDGTDDLGEVAPDGAYYFFIETKDNLGNYTNYSANVIKNTIDSEISSPQSDEVLSSGLEVIKGTAVDFLDFDYFTVDFYQGDIGYEGVVKGSDKDGFKDKDGNDFTDDLNLLWYYIPVCEDLQGIQSKIPGINKEYISLIQVQNGKMAEWETVGFQQGKYTLRLQVFDKSGNVIKYFRTVEIDNPLFLYDVEVLDPVFTPDGDGVKDVCGIRGKVSENADITIEVYDGNNVLKTSWNFQGNKGQFDAQWNGRDNSSQVCADGKYKIVVKTEDNGLVLAEERTVFINNANIGGGITAEITEPQTGMDTAGSMGIYYLCQAKPIGKLIKDVKFKIRLGVNAVYHQYTVNFPVYGGPYYINWLGAQENWDGTGMIGPYSFIDSKGNVVLYDSEPTCDFSQPGVNQGNLFNTVGETEGELKIFYQNIAENPYFMFQDVDIVDVQRYKNGFEVKLYNKPIQAGTYALGTESKIWFYCNSPRTYYGEIPYYDYIELTGVCGKDDNSFRLYLGDKEITGMRLEEILELTDQIVQRNYYLEISGVTFDIDSDNYTGNEELFKKINLYFTTKGPGSTTKHVSNSDDDTIQGISLREESWNSSSIFIVEDVFAEQDSVKSYSFPDDVPENAIISGWNIELLDYDKKNNKYLEVQNITEDSFQIVRKEQYINRRYVKINGNIICNNFKYYILENSQFRNYNERFNNQDINLNNEILGIWDITDIDEGEYKLLLTVADNNENSKIITKDIRINIPFDLNVSVTPQVPNFFSPDYKKAVIKYSITESAGISISIYNKIDDALITNFLTDEIHSAGDYQIEWNGRDKQDNIVQDGDYYVEIIAKDIDLDNNGDPLEIIKKTNDISVKYINKPIEMNAQINITSITPNEDGINDICWINGEISEEADITAEVYDDADVKIRDLQNKIILQDLKFKIDWDGKDDNEDIADEGNYTIKVKAVADDNNLDIVENQSAVKVEKSFEDETVFIQTPEENKVVSGTAGALYWYKTKAYGKKAPKQDFEWEINVTANEFWVEEEYGTINKNIYQTHDDFLCKPCGKSSAVINMDQDVQVFFQYGCASDSTYRQFTYSVKKGDVISVKTYFADVWNGSDHCSWDFYVNGNPIAHNDYYVSSTCHARAKVLYKSYESIKKEYKFESYNNTVSGNDIVFFKDGDKYLGYHNLIPYPQHGGMIYNIKTNIYCSNPNVAVWNIGNIVYAKTEINEDWETQEMINKNLSVIFNPSLNEIKQTVDISADTGFEIPDDIVINNWQVEVFSDNDSIIVDPESYVDPQKNLISGDGKFNVILDTTKEKKYADIKGEIGEDFKSYVLYYTEGSDISECEWQELVSSIETPVNDLLYKWDITGLYGVYTLLLEVRKQNGNLVQYTRTFKIGNVVSREAGGVACSPYRVLELNFPPDAIPSNETDDIPETENILDKIVDALPIPSDEVNASENYLQIVGPVFELKPSGMRFDKPLTLKYHYNEEIENQYDESRLGTYHVKDDGSVEYIPCYIDKDNNIIIVPIYGFSKYTLVYDSSEIPVPKLDYIPDVTKNRKIDISGQTVADHEVEIYLNDELKGKAVVDGIKFEFNDLNLAEGVNIIKAVAVNYREVKSEPAVFQVICDTISPEFKNINKENIVFSPNQDSIKDELILQLTLNEPGKINILHYDNNDNFLELKEILSFNQNEIDYNWDGKLNGVLQNEGIYKLKITAYDEANNKSLDTSESVIKAVIDYTAPVIESFEQEATSVQLNENKKLDNFVFKFSASDFPEFDENILLVNLKIYNNNDILIKELLNEENKKINYSIEWDKTDSFKNAVSEGNYYALLKISDKAGNFSEKMIDVKIDYTHPVDEHTISVESLYISPNNDLMQDNFITSFMLNEKALVKLTVLDKQENMIKTIEQEMNDIGKNNITWDGKDENKNLVQEGIYFVGFFAVDDVGNELIKNYTVTVDLTSPECDIVNQLKMKI